MVRSLMGFMILLAGLLPMTGAWAQKGVFLEADQLHQQAFPDRAMRWQTLWVSKSQRNSIEKILNHSFHNIRVRYWGEGARTVWIFEEIGKELPITIGVTVEAGKISDVAVLEYRESRGGEVRYPFFTKQFHGLGLKADAEPALSGHIDGITGATLSVRAMKKIATLALFCHQLTPFAQHVDSTATR